VRDRLRSLERDLGAPVVRRRGRGIDLTAAGRAALEPLRRAAAARSESRAALRAAAAGTTAHVELAVSVTAGAYLVAGALVAQPLSRIREPQPVPPGDLGRLVSVLAR
jgi:DNA-binding transcriptional LysR family regulator